MSGTERGLPDNMNTEDLKGTEMEDKATTTESAISPFDEIRPDAADDRTAREAAMGVPVDVQVVVGKAKLSVKEVMSIHRGAVVELDSKASDLVDITVNGKVLAKGELTVYDDGRLGVTFVDIVRTGA